MEFDHSEIYSPVDLKVGKCRLSVAGPKELAATGGPNAMESSKDCRQNTQISLNDILRLVGSKRSA